MGNWSADGKHHKAWYENDRMQYSEWNGAEQTIWMLAQKELRIDILLTFAETDPLSLQPLLNAVESFYADLDPLAFDTISKEFETEFKALWKIVRHRNRIYKKKMITHGDYGLEKMKIDYETLDRIKEVYKLVIRLRQKTGMSVPTKRDNMGAGRLNITRKTAKDFDQVSQVL